MYTLYTDRVLNGMLQKDTRCLVQAWQCCYHLRESGRALSPFYPQACFH